MQAKGSLSRLVMAFENTYGSLPAVPVGKVMPFNTCGLKGDAPKNTPDTITGRRDPVRPFEGNQNVTGAIVVPVDFRNFPWWLRGCFGAPASTVNAAVNIDNAAAVDKGGGTVGIPITGHPFSAGDSITIIGTTNYDDDYTVLAASTTDEVVVTAAYQAEVFAGTEAAALAVQSPLFIDNDDAVDKGDGTVGIPATAHGLSEGDSITIAGTVAYNGNYTVLGATTTNEIVITTTYAAETFAGTELAYKRYNVHVFTIGDSMPSMVIERRFTDGAAFTTYMCSLGCRVGKLSIDVGGDGELTASLDITGASETNESTAIDATPDSLGILRAHNKQASLLEGGAALAAIGTKFSMNIDFGLDTDSFTIGGGGVRGDLPEGIVKAEGSLEVLFKNATIMAKAIAGSESSIQCTLTSGIYTMDFLFSELEYARTAPAVDGPKGVRMSLPWMAYFDDSTGDSVVTVTVANDVASYA